MTKHDFGYRTDFYTFAPETLAQELSDYEIVREVGKGSMGIVYEAHRKSDGELVALKVLPPSLTLTDRALARFVKEGEVMSRIEHPSIVRVFEHGLRGRLHYFAMEFVAGTTLEQRIQIGPLPVRDAAEYCAQIADALQYAHDRGVVHRDIKPGNLILTEDRRVVITDFGLARETGTGSFTESGAIVGTPMYMAPEQILGHRSDVDSRADVYGLGATLFELLTGRPPFVAPTAQGVLREVLETEPPRPAKYRAELPIPIEAITLRALAKQPEQRYGSAQEFADDLRRFLAGEAVYARLPTRVGAMLRLTRRHPYISTLLVVTILLAIGLGFLYRDNTRQRRAELIDQAELQFTKATSRREAGFRRLQPQEKAALLTESVELVTSVLVEDESNLRAWILRGRVHRELQDWSSAIYDFDRATALVKKPREDLLRYRIDTLQNLGEPTVLPRLMADLRSLLELDRSPETICLVADYLLRFAAAIPDPGARVEILTRVDAMLDKVDIPSGPASIARAQLAQLRNDREQALTRASNACIEFPGDPFVHFEAARIFRALGLIEKAKIEASMARMLRGEEHSEALPAPRQQPAGALDTGSLRGWLQDLGTLFGENSGKTP